MSSRKKKPVSPWVICGGCSAHMHERDINNHERYCPPQDTSFPYVLKSILRCSLEVFTIKDSAGLNLPEDTLGSMIFLSNAALQLCGIAFGSWVVVSLDSGEEFVRRAWKAHDRSTLSAALYEKDMWAGIDKIATVRLLDDYVEVANEISLEAESDNFETIIDVTVCLKHLYSNRILKDGKGAVFYKVLPETNWHITSREEPRSAVVDPGIAGLHSVREEINDCLSSVMQGIPGGGSLRARGVLLHGPSGTGKSLLMRSEAKKWGKTVINITNMGSTDTDASVYLDSVMLKAQRGAPTIVTIDDVDAFCGKTARGSDGSNGFALAAFFDRLRSVEAAIVVMATTNNVNEISRCLRRPGRFDKELEIGVPTPMERLEILHVLLGRTHVIDMNTLKELADAAHGFVGADLAALVTKAEAFAFKERSQIKITHLRCCLGLIKPSAMREIMLQVPNVRWDEVGGQASLKHQLRQSVEWPLKYPDSFKRLGVSPPRGLLMYGPPGCSKTMIAKALATESGLNFFSVKGPELFSCWVGDSEKAVRDVFRRARQSAPAIIFFDELDALAGERTGSQSGGAQVQERVLAQLLTELDGVEALGDVIVVGATNRPDRIDPALLRPGRLDRVVYVPLPDSSTRHDIFLIQLRKTPVAKDVDVMELVSRTEGYSGAEVVAVCREAAMNALSEDINSCFVTRKNFLEALKSVAPRTSESALSLCEKYKNRQLIFK